MYHAAKLNAAHQTMTGKILLHHQIVKKQLCVVVFLYNCYVCLHGSKFSRFFYVMPPSLEEYLGIEIDED